MIYSVCKNCYCLHDEVVCPECRSAEYCVINPEQDTWVYGVRLYGLNNACKYVVDGTLQDRVFISMNKQIELGYVGRFRNWLIGGILKCIKLLTK